MMNSDDNISQTTSLRRRRRWLLPVALVLVGMIVLGVCISRIEVRRQVIGRTDPATGFRYRFMVGQGWKDNPAYKSQSDFAFKVPDPSAFQVWMENHLLPRTKSRPSFVFEPVLRVESNSDSMVGGFELQDGYPTFHFPTRPASSRAPSTIIPVNSTIVEQKHLLLSGQPAVWVVVSDDLSVRGIRSGFSTSNTLPIYGYIFTIKVRNQPLWYQIRVSTDEAHKDQMRREVEAIAESFHIERTGGNE